MSQDLFAAFGSPEPPPSELGGRPGSHHLNGKNSSRGQAVALGDGLAAAGANHSLDEEDDFGDFEDASNGQPITEVAGARPEPETKLASPNAVQKQKSSYPPPKPTPAVRSTPASRPPEAPAEPGRHPFADHMDLLFGADDDEYDAGTDEMADLATNPEAAMAYSKRVIAAQQRGVPRSSASVQAARSVSASTHEPNKLRKKSAYVPAPGAEVLFDAEATQTEDDFGDYENLDDAANESDVVTSRLAVSDLNRLSLDQHEQQLVAHPRAALDVPDEDAWDDFEVAEEPNIGRGSQQAPSLAGDSSFRRATSAMEAKATTSISNELPPTNVPPPAVLLSIFPSIFASGDEALLTPPSKLDMKQRQMLLAHPATHMFLRGYTDIMIVLAHIVAGRKLRWKRDQHLAQSMRIGPAAAGGKGGMKLAGIDKAEVAKEDREVLDTLRLWKAQVGRLRSSVTSATTSMPDGKDKMELPPVPEISEQAMPVKTLKATEGGMTAPHACALCGLKRDERVAKVDVEVEDSFGEYWVDGTNMHLLCRNFWNEYKGKLRSR
ncbi:hypothetical protein LTR53_006984 [Teratosphaeriaceae sp. CCFEE 6253]|nr:hypothetical protein LTR53_006984 [Teratosphaeriaceae sp. CCFEE 6253]